YFYVATQSGNYNVVCTDDNDCEVEAGIFNVVAGIGFEVSGLGFTVVPNPVVGEFEIGNLKLGTAASISIFNLVGEIVYKEDARGGPWTVDCGRFPNGIYYLKITDGGKI